MKALILAGGFGTRLQSVLPNVPKPMAFVGGKPFLEILLLRLKAQGFNEFYLLLHYKSKVIVDYFFNKKEFKIHFITEDKPLGTGGSIINAIKHFNIDDDIFIFNGDSFVDVDCKDIVLKHKQNTMTICIVNVKDGYRYGRVKTDGNIVTNFTEKDGLHSPASINAGVYLVNAKDLINEAVRIGKDCFSMEKEIFENPKRHIPLLTYHCCDTYFIDIGTPDDYHSIKNGFFNKRKKS